MLRILGEYIVNAQSVASTTSWDTILDSVDQVAIQAVYTNGTTAAKTFVYLSGNAVTMTGHGQVTGSVGQLTTTGALPTGLSTSTNYYLIIVDANTVKFATSLANAVAGTAVTLTGAGSGTETFTPTALSGNVCKLQASNDGTNFSDITGNTVTIGAAGNTLWDLARPSYRVLRVLYTPSAGTTVLSVIINGKKDGGGE